LSETFQGKGKKKKRKRKEKERVRDQKEYRKEVMERIIEPKLYLLSRFPFSLIKSHANDHATVRLYLGLRKPLSLMSTLNLK
jgi:hypothetical protein